MEEKQHSLNRFIIVFLSLSLVLGIVYFSLEKATAMPTFDDSNVQFELQQTQCASAVVNAFTSCQSSLPICISQAINGIERCTGTQQPPSVASAQGVGVLCPGDFNNDLEVNKDDLTILEDNWGNGGETDLNGNGVTDFDDILALITNFWGPCPPTCSQYDITDDGEVNEFDLNALIAAWGSHADPHPADFDQDGAVDFADLLLILSNWGFCN